MRKIITMMMLCLMLCALGTTAFAATLTYFDYFDQYNEIEVSEGTYALPQLSGVGFTQPAGQTFYGWRVIGKEGYYKPGTVIDITSDKEIMAYYLDTSMMNELYEVKVISQEYNKHSITAYYPCSPDTLMWIPYPYQYGFGSDRENIDYFLYWEITGPYEKFDPGNYDGPEVGWLFARALADESGTLNPGDYFYVQGDLTIKAIWKNGASSTPVPTGTPTTAPTAAPTTAPAATPTTAPMATPTTAPAATPTTAPAATPTTAPAATPTTAPMATPTTAPTAAPNPGVNPGVNPGAPEVEEAIENMPKTGDESLPMSMLFVVAAVSICGICLLKKRSHC